MDSEKWAYWLVGGFFVVFLFLMLFSVVRYGGPISWSLGGVVLRFVLLSCFVLWFCVFAWPARFPTWLGVIIIVSTCIAVLPSIFTIIQGFLIGLVLKNTTYDSAGMDPVSYLATFVFMFGMAVGMIWLFIIEKKRALAEVKK